ncbi:MAG: BNR-repeat neuraminidase N-terminal domain-containing protein [Bacteroidota bacterium]
MKKIACSFAFLAISFLALAQTNYNINYTNSGGNPGVINTDNDDVVAGWTQIIAPSINTNQWSLPVSIPFAFNFYGHPVTEFKANANGLLTFNTATTTLPNYNDNLPSVDVPDSTVACYWDAFTAAPPTNSNDVVVWKVWGTAPNRQLWIKWVSMEIGAPAIGDITFACVLEEGSDKIYLVEGTFNPLSPISTPTTSVTTGIQLNSSTAKQFDTKYRLRNVNTNSLTDNNFIEFSPYTIANMSVNNVSCAQPVTDKIAKNTNNNAILSINVNTAGELNPLTLTQLAFNTSGTTNTGDLSNAQVFYTGADSNFNTSQTIGTLVSNPNGTFTINGSQVLTVGDNYFWLSYGVNNTATVSNVIDAECMQVVVNSNIVTTTNSAPVGNRTIGNGLSGNITVGTGADYNLLSEAFQAINTEGLNGNLNISIVTNIVDTGAAILNVNNNNYSISILSPDNILKTIEATKANYYIDLVGTQKLVIDGKDPVSGTGKFLRFINKSASGSTFKFSNGANFDTIRNCIIEGALALQTMGVIHIAGTNNSVSNANISIENNDIRNRSDSMGIPTILIYSQGSVNAPNHTIRIDNNNLFNFNRSGVYVSPTGNGGNWTISNNSFYYNTSAQLLTTDLVCIMMIPGVLSNNNHINNNYFGGNAPLCGGFAWTENNARSFVAMNINSGVDIGTSVQGNTIQNLNIISSGTNLAFIGIRIESGRIEAGNITGNIVGHPSIAGSITTNIPLNYCIYGTLQGVGELIISNNTVANITASNTTSGSSLRGIAIQGGAVSPYIYNNNIYNLHTNSATSGPTTGSLHGIGLLSGTNIGTVYIGKNKVSNLNNNSVGAVIPTGIVIDNLSQNGIIENNTISNIVCGSTNTGAAIHGIYLTGPKNWIVRNNTIALSNGINTNPITIRGISDFASGNTISYFNNTIYVGGTAASGALNSFAFERRNANSIPVLRNNILYNDRTGGTGVHSAIANVVATPSSNWTANTSSYNLLVAASPSSIGAWSSAFTPQSLSQWISSSGSDVNSWADTTANVPANTFFKDLANGDLTIDSSTALCWYAKGKGIAIAGNTNDIQGQSRSTTIAAGAVDIGADEFSTVTLPPFAIESATPTNSSTTDYSFAGRTVASFIWGAAGTVPSIVNIRYYSGVAAPNLIPATTHYNAHYRIGQIAGSGYDYTVKLLFDSAVYGNTSSSNTARLAYYQSPNWNLLNSSTATISTNMLSSNITLTDNTLPAYFTGTDNINALPVKLVQFTAKPDNNDVLLNWQSAMELNANQYQIEVSTNGINFNTIGSVKASGNTNSTNNYSFTHQQAFAAVQENTLYYRLKIIDNDTRFTYSKTAIVRKENKQNTLINIYPNPVSESTAITIVTNTEQLVTVSIFDLKGNQLINKTLPVQNGENSIHMDEMNALSKGIYFVHVNTAIEKVVIKLVK